MDTRYPTITGSFISNLAFCEYKAVAFRSGVVVRRSKPRIILRRIAERLAGKEINVDLGSVTGEVRGIPVAIAPGSLILDSKGMVRGLLRPIIRSRLRIYEEDFAPLRVAALVLDAKGRLIGDTRLIVSVGVDEESLEKAIEWGLVERRPGKGPGWVVSTRIYSSEDSMRIIERAVEVILDPGAAKPASYPSKCSVCEHRVECPYAVR